MATSGSDHRRVLITGSTAGIGRVLAEALADDGCEVILTATDESHVEAAVDEFRSRGFRAHGLVLRLELPESVEAALRRYIDRFDALDMLVLNAAMGGVRVPMTDYPPDIWRAVFEANVHATQRLLAGLHPMLEKAAAGRVLFMSSGVARNRKAMTGAYAASKAAADAIGGIYAVEQAGSTIRSNILNPGPTRTGMRAAAFPHEDPANLKPPETLLPLLRLLLSVDGAPHGQLIDAESHPLVQAEVAHLPTAPKPLR
jgi:NAD(P)-dependent dehydrogenase (short-subunit alcohol dehydrogenase family)